MVVGYSKLCAEDLIFRLHHNLTFSSGLKSFDISDFFCLLEKMCSCILDNLVNSYFLSKKFSAFVERQDRRDTWVELKFTQHCRALVMFLCVGSWWGSTSSSTQDCGISDKDGEDGVAITATTFILITIQTKLIVTGLCGTSVFCWKLVYASVILHKKIHSPAALNSFSKIVHRLVKATERDALLSLSKLSFFIFNIAQYS